MGVFTDARADLAGRLVDAGVVGVSVDQLGVPPMVLVGLPERVEAANLHHWSAVLPVWVIAPPPGGVDSITWLLDTLPLVLHTLYPFDVVDPEPYQLAGKDCPAFRVDVPVTLTNPYS